MVVVVVVVVAVDARKIVNMVLTSPTCTNSDNQMQKRANNLLREDKGLIWKLLDGII